MMNRKEGIGIELKRSPNNTPLKKYPNFQRYYKAKEVKCILGRENSSYTLSFQWYLNGDYAHTDPSKVLECFVNSLEELPNTVSLTLEKRIAEVDEASSVLLVAVDALKRQRENNLSKLNTLSNLKKEFDSFS